MIHMGDKLLIERLKKQVEEWRALENGMTPEKKESMIQNILKLIESLEGTKRD